MDQKGDLMEIKELTKKMKKHGMYLLLNLMIQLFSPDWMEKTLLKKTYGHKPIYLFAEEDGEVKGILPLFLIKSLIFDKKLVSLPFTMYGGVCSEDDTVINALVEEEKMITTELDVDYL